MKKKKLIAVLTLVCFMFTLMPAAAMANSTDATADTSWYNDTDTEFTLSTAAELAGLAKLVDEGNTFAGKTVKLGANIDLYCEDENGDVISFNPIGSYRNETPFKGIFDGQNHTIRNLSQNTWALDTGYYYVDLGLGLFGKVEDATIKNLNMDNATISGESGMCGTVAAAAYGDCKFENITVTNSKVADYQYYAGGIVGWASGNHQYTNCTVDASTIIAAQWGDFDNSTGGVIGGAGGSAIIKLKDCNVACRIDAYNDVTSSYQWYAYRRCGMLIGNTGKTTTNENGATVAAAPQLTCENVTVTYGDWADYTYCEFAGKNWPYVRVQAGISNSAYSNPRYGHPTDANGNEVVDDNHVHNDSEDHFIECTFDQLYGGGQGVYGTATHDGVTVKKPVKFVFHANYDNNDETKIIKYNPGTNVTLPGADIFDREGWALISWSTYNKWGNMDYTYDVERFIGNDHVNAGKSCLSDGTPVEGEVHFYAGWTPKASIMDKYAVYATEYYVQQPDGTYEVVDREMKSAKLSSEVSVTPEAKTGYDINTEKSVLSATVDMPKQNSATDEVDVTTLKVYYDRHVETVNVVIYRNGDITKPYATVSAGLNVVKGETIDLTKLNVADYYSHYAGFEYDGWFNDGKWNEYKAGKNVTGLDEIKVNGWTNLICMVTDYEKVIVKGVTEDDKANAETIFEGKALKGADLIAFLNENVTVKDKEGCTMDKWYNWDWYGHKVGENATVNGWTNVYVTYTLIPYTVSFDSNGGTPVADQTVKYGKTATKPAYPTNGDLVFQGWYLNDVQYDFATPVKGNVELTAKWAAKASQIEPKFSAYQVEHYLQDANGEYVLKETQFPLYGEIATEITVEPNKYDGYTAQAVKPVVLEEAKVVDGKAVVTIVKFYYDLNKYAVSFDSKGGTEVKAQEVKHGAAAVKPADPTRNGYTFAGWYLNDTQYDFVVPVKGDVTLVAKWNSNSTSSSKSSGGGFYGKYNYPVNILDTVGADVIASKNHAVAGETVTITIAPDMVKQVDEVIVTDEKGNVIPVTKVGSNKYSFTMPASKVNVFVTTEAADYDQYIVLQINNKNILVNNRTITNDVAPVIVGDRTMVPVRVVTELLGGSADWDEATRTVTLNIDGKVLKLVIDQPIPGFGTSATIIDSRTYVPIRYVAEKLGASVEWIADTQQIVIEK